MVPRRPQDPPKTPKVIFMQLVKNTVALNMKVHPFCDFWWSRWAPWRLHSKHYLLYFASFSGLQNLLIFVLFLGPAAPMGSKIDQKTIGTCTLHVDSLVALMGSFWKPKVGPRGAMGGPKGAPGGPMVAQGVPQGSPRVPNVRPLGQSGVWVFNAPK